MINAIKNSKLGQYFLNTKIAKKIINTRKQIETSHTNFETSRNKTLETITNPIIENAYQSLTEKRNNYFKSLTEKRDNFYERLTSIRTSLEVMVQ